MLMKKSMMSNHFKYIIIIITISKEIISYIIQRLTTDATQNIVTIMSAIIIIGDLE